MIFSVWNAVLCVATESGRVRVRKKIPFCYTAITGGYATRFSMVARCLESRVFVGWRDVVIARAT
jgi:hypothetical protein